MSFRGLICSKCCLSLPQWLSGVCAYLVLHFVWTSWMSSWSKTEHDERWNGELGEYISTERSCYFIIISALVLQNPGCTAGSCVEESFGNCNCPQWSNGNLYRSHSVRYRETFESRMRIFSVNSEEEESRMRIFSVRSSWTGADTT